MQENNIFKNITGKHKSLVLYSVAALFMVAVAMNMITSNTEEVTESEMDVKVKLVSVSDYYGSQSAVETIAEVEALEQMNINSQLSATVKKINIEIGDKVLKGDLLVELDHATLDAQLAQASARVSNAKSAYDKLIEGASQETVAQSVAGLENAKATNNVAIRNAELALEQAELALKNSKKSNGQMVTDAYDSLRTGLSANLSNVYNALVSAGDILGEAPGNETGNKLYDNLFSVKNLTLKTSSKQYFQTALSNYQDLKPKVDSLGVNTAPQEIITMGDGMLALLDSTIQALNTISVALENTVTSSSFTAQNLNGLKSQISGQLALLNQSKQVVLATKQKVISLNISDNNTSEADTQQYERALENLRLIKAQTSSAYAVQIAGHNTLIAQARSEDIASAKAALQEAQAAYSQVAASRNYAFIRAPFDSTVAVVSVDLGDLLSLGTPIISVVNDSGLQLRSYIAEQDRALMQTGTKVEIEGGYSGSLARIAPSIDPETKKIEILVAVESEKTSLTVGQFASLKIAINKNIKDNIYYLPLKAIEMLSDSGLVYTVDENNTLVSHEVTLGKVVDEKITVTNGIDSSWKILQNVRGVKTGESVIIK